MTRASAAPVREGDLLAGKYRVERVIGVGGMGVVVAARHEQLDQLVALKFVRDDALENDEAVQRFIREARAAVKLKSEHVARVLDVGKLETGAPYMVMEFLEGSDLGRVLEDGGPLPVETAVDWVMQACEAVAEAHAAGIVHRDLKPENLFLARTVGGMSKVKVLDFGVSKAVSGGRSGELSGLTRTRAMLGSPLYMAPEQMRSSRDVEPMADVWALGVVLFQLLTLHWPFEAETMPELCLKVVTEAPQSLAGLRPDVPPALVAIVEQCLEKDPSHRFANAADLSTALEPFGLPASRVLAERARLAMGSGTAAYESMPRVRSVPDVRTLQSESGSLPDVPRSLPRSRTPNAPGSRGPLASGLITPGSGRRTPGSGASGSGGAEGASPVSSGVTPAPGSRTPGTSAAWGATDGGSTSAQPGLGAPIKVGLGLAAVAGAVAVAFVLRGPVPTPAPPDSPAVTRTTAVAPVIPATGAPAPPPAATTLLAPAPSAAEAATRGPSAAEAPVAAPSAAPPAVPVTLAPAPSARPLASHAASPVGPAHPVASDHPVVPSKGPAPGDDDIPTIR